MAISYIDVAGAQSGPGSYRYGQASYPGGAVLFVNSATGKDSRDRVKFMGQTSQSGVTPSGSQGPTGDPSKPLASIFGANGAISFCTANKGDTIIVAGGHTENLAGGAAVSIPAGVSIIGAGYGADRPKITWTAAGSFLQPGGSCHFENLVFDQSGVASVTKGFLVNKSGVQFVGCKIILSSATNQATDGIVINASGNDFLFHSSEIVSLTAGAARGISNPASNNVDNLQIILSNLRGDFSEAPISILSTGTTGIRIADNWLQNANAASVCLNLATGNTITGIINDNRVMMAGTTKTTFIANGGGTGYALLQNFAWDTKAATASGILIPAAGTL